MKRKRLHHRFSLGRQSSLALERDLAADAQPSEALEPDVRLRCLSNENDLDGSKELLDAGRVTLISKTSTLHIAASPPSPRRCGNHWNASTTGKKESRGFIGEEPL
ncbi:hypothetical protein VNO77_08982 [Canavalia gladiata]|uniref:Uncharacterized protein n=1 Tax=Canavalia gladiata TaxID=3824 RepID=A0AAN9M8V0_CANGL